MRLFGFAPTLLVWLSASSAFAQNPVSSKATIFGSNGTITLDYGHNVEGFPTFQVLSTSGNIEGFKIRYSETKAVLESNPNVGHLRLRAHKVLVLTSGKRAMAPPV
jgi:hypothetical protein